MKDDTISRAAAIDAICEDGTQRERQGQYSITMVDRKYLDTEILEALPSVQPTGTNTVQVEDCISRAAIVDAIEGVDWYHMTDSGEMVHGANSAEDQPWYKAEDIYAAIEALPSAQPDHIGEVTEMVGDVISRQAMLNEINLHVGILYDNPTLVESLKLLVWSLPSAQTERKKGKWIERNPRNSPDCRLIECSECGNAYIVGYNINYDDWIDGRNFCMKCGADLRGGSNGKST